MLHQDCRLHVSLNRQTCNGPLDFDGTFNQNALPFSNNHHDYNDYQHKYQRRSNDHGLQYNPNYHIVHRNHYSLRRLRLE